MVKNGSDGRRLPDGRKKNDPRLFRKFILWTILCSLVPLLLVGWGINIYYSRFARERMLNLLQTQVEYHKKIIELFLAEHSAKLHLIAHSHPKTFLTQVSNLRDIFETVNRGYNTITDLGVIDALSTELITSSP